MDYTGLILPELLILVPVLSFLGIALKKSKLPDRWIPLVLGVTAVALSFLWFFAHREIGSIYELADALFQSFTPGVLILFG